MASRTTFSTARPLNQCAEKDSPRAGRQAASMASPEPILSKMPSVHIKMKSCSLLSSKTVISGSLITTPGLPPSRSSLASGSPTVRETERRPGNTRSGPTASLTTLEFDLSSTCEVVWNILPPARSIRTCSPSSQGLWSRVRLVKLLPRPEDRTALQSPTLARQHFPPTSSAASRVEPLRYSEFSQCSRKASSAYFIPLRRASTGLSGNSACRETRLWRLSLRKSQHPAPPWPSYSPKKQAGEGSCLSLPRLRMMETLSSLQVRTSPRLVQAAQLTMGPLRLLEVLMGSPLGRGLSSRRRAGCTLARSFWLACSQRQVASWRERPVRTLEVVTFLQLPSTATEDSKGSSSGALGRRAISRQAFSLLWRALGVREVGGLALGLRHRVGVVGLLACEFMTVNYNCGQLIAIKQRVWLEYGWLQRVGLKGYSPELIIRYMASKVVFNLPKLLTHRGEQLAKLPLVAETNRDEAFRYLRSMEVMRWMELECEQLYRNRQIRGFLHLYYGQEAIPEGMEDALTHKDAYCGAYRIHCNTLKRGYSVRAIISEMLGKGAGAATGGRGGSMHYYHRENNFYGGNGIVGAQVPVATGLAFAQKYKKEKNITVAAFGDGAANQGQIFEAMNMAGLWKLPIIYMCENNKYGMGTSIERASHNPQFYKRGDLIPGIRLEADNVFLVREVFRWGKQYCLEHGPLVLELMTYRYFGHSMSDPGTSYRTRDEINAVRKSKDPINFLRAFIQEHKLGSPEECEKVEEEAKAHVKAECELAKQDPQPDPESIYQHTYVDNNRHFIRGVAYEESQFPS